MASSNSKDRPQEHNISMKNGQRKYGGPPPNWSGPPPKKGSEVFVGKLPRDLLEDSLLPLFESVGQVYEMRLMMDYNGCNRGYAFVTFGQPADATKAIQKLNNYEIRPKRFIGVIKSLDNSRLFVGGIPKDKTEADVMEVMSRLTDGVVRVILYSAVADKTKNRGFAFVEYESHRSAAVARRKCISSRLQLWGKNVAVDWAEPEPLVDDEILSKVKILYVRNLVITTKEEELESLFNGVSENGVEKVKILDDFAFVHLRSREQAERAMEALQNEEVNGSRIQITWAKPVVDKQRHNNQRGVGISKGHQPPAWISLLPTWPHHPLFSHQYGPHHFPLHFGQHHLPPQYHHPLVPRPPPLSNNYVRGVADRVERPIPPPMQPAEKILHPHQLPVTNNEGDHQGTWLNGGQLPNHVEELTSLCRLHHLGEPAFEVYRCGDAGFSAKVSVPHLGPPFNHFQAIEAYETEEEARQVIAGCALSHLNQTLQPYNGVTALNSHLEALTLQHHHEPVVAAIHPENFVVLDGRRVAV